MKKLLFIECMVILLLVKFSAAQVCSPSQTTRVLLLGDSWTHIMWNNKTYRDVFDKIGHADKIEKGENTAIGGTTASYWALPANLSLITNELNANPSIDIVLLSIGGNDFLAGINGPIPGWHTGLNTAQETTLFNNIEANIQTIINTIKAVRPDIEVVLSGYDFLNLAETVINDPTGPTGLFWINLGQPDISTINQALARMEQRKINIANSDPRVYYVQSFGLMQYIYGYPALLPVAPFATFPAGTTPFPGQTPPSYSPFPGGNTSYPSPPIALANNGADAIHLSDDGYHHLVEHQSNYYFKDKFRENPDMTFISEGNVNDGWVRSNGATGYGGVRIGDASGGDSYRGIFSFNTSNIPDNATIIRASIYLTRSSGSGTNPFQSGSLGSPTVDVKSGSFGLELLEALDFNTPADASDAGCFIGTVSKNGYVLRIDLQASGYNTINKTGKTQFRLAFPTPDFIFDDYTTFYNGNNGNSLSPNLDVFYTIPPLASAAVSGDTSICIYSPVNLHVDLTGTPPWSLTWSDGHANNGITASPFVRTLFIDTTTLFTLTTVSDANGPGVVSGSALIEGSDPHLYGMVIGPDSALVADTVSYYYTDSSHSIIWLAPNGQIISGQGTDTIDVIWQSEGLQYVVVFNDDPMGCYSDTTGISVVVRDQSTFIRNLSQTSFTIAPNPFKDIAHITLPDFTSETFSLRLIDLNGKVIRQVYYINTTEITFSSIGITPGIYFIEIIGKKRFVEKVAVY